MREADVLYSDEASLYQPRHKARQLQLIDLVLDGTRTQEMKWTNSWDYSNDKAQHQKPTPIGGRNDAPGLQEAVKSPET